LTGDKLFLDKATHVADKLMPAFKSPTGIPFALINMRTGTAKNYGWASGGSSILSEFGTLHMEFAYLSDVTGDPSYKKAVEKVRDAIQSAARPRNLYPNYLNPKTGKWGQQHTSMGALGDSFYEYLLKEWLRSGKTDNVAKEMFDQAATDVENELIKTSASGLTYFAEQKYGKLEHKMDHLACFGAGMYGLAAHEEKDENSARWMEIAKGITNTCHESYDRSDTKLGPEAFRFTEAVEARAMKANERYYILRPETIESYFVMWRLTHDQKYRDWGWEAVQALETHCKAPGGYSGIKNVYQANVLKDDVQQSFFLAETLKYLYLLFSDDELISLDEWVFNTEAHPLPIKGHNKFYRSSNDIDTGAIKVKKSDILAASADAVLLH
jgi:mannosyl-oligosaccharide alpha-1,2-mannosidase